MGDMHDSEMHRPSLGAVVIDYRNGCIFHRIHGDLFQQLAPHAVMIAAIISKQPMVFLGNMPSNSERVQSVQTRFLTAFSPPIAQDPSLTEKEDVGNELFETPVLFGVRPVKVQQIHRCGYNGQIPLHLEAQPLKGADLLEEVSPETKHSFFYCHDAVTSNAKLDKAPA